ncbi:LysR family transcriptional regulator [Piscinibacter terrae]|uniref:LysR family transcriptional regulator n=1 Tax=Piscinibacter terrae TaxID=2496871 RepID=A0A3N7K5E6_9BURK|nr:LysR family transcriptional regulator [Albitalea terrae]RQP26135.1 LysR family transcriptional regulator [Albitalea terrae]
MPDALRHITLRQIQIFLAAAEHSSFARAAQLLHLTQPAVSMQMSQLADVVGSALFERQGRKIVLTQAGQTLVPYAERVAQTLREAGDALDALQGLRHGKLRIAVVATTRYFAPRLLAMFRQEHPQIELEVNILGREGVIAQLESNHADLAIMGRPPANLPVVAEVFARHPHGVIAPPDHPLAGKKRLAPGRIADEPFIAREHGSGTRAAMDQYFAEHALDPPIAQEMPSNESIKQAVMGGMGLAFISLHTVNLEHRTGHLVLLDLRGLPVMRDWYVLHRATRQLSPAAQAFKQFMHAQAPKYMKTLLPK